MSEQDPETAEEVQAAPELAKARSDEEVAAVAHAAVVVTEEDTAVPDENGIAVEAAPVEKEDQ